MNYDVKEGIKALIDIQNAIEAKVETLQIGVNDYDVNVTFVAKGKLNVEQINEVILHVDNYGYYTGVASLDLPPEQLIVAQSVHDYFMKDGGFYTDDYLCDLFEHKGAEVAINTTENKVTFDSDTAVYELTMDEFVNKLVEDYKENEDKFTAAFTGNYQQTKMSLKMVASQIASNEIKFDQIILLKSYANISQVNESIVTLSNKLESIYYKYKPIKKQPTENKDEAPQQKFDFNKALYVVVIIVGICLFSSVIIMLFTKPPIEAGINSVVRSGY